MTEQAVVDKVAVVADAAAAAGRIDHIEMSIRTFFVSVTDDRDAQLASIAGMIGVDEAMVGASPFALIGSPAEIVDQLVERRERFGFSYVIVGPEVIDAFAPVVDRLAGT
jgi:alkanesulfonate monooxygenase SsuD/methylene tetrahydromethanopterin reductase-like flavin-dependent oxidoreductase (luciferase family)